jgi:hypothetical protein
MLGSIFLFVLCANALASEDRFVAPDGNDANNGLSRQAAFRTLGAACRATPHGCHTIHVAAGEYEEEKSCVLAPGVSLTGEGIGKTIFRWKEMHSLESNPMGYDFNAFLIQMQDSSEASISGLTIIGTLSNDKRAHAGILASKVRNVAIHDCELRGLEFTGVWLTEATNSSVYDCRIEDCGYPNKNSCSAGLLVGALTDCAIHHNTIRDHRGAYGIKTWLPLWTALRSNVSELMRNKVNLVRVRLHDNDIKVRQLGGWGSGQPNIVAELWNAEPSDCEIYNNRFNECVSVATGNAAKTIRIHHNLFILEPGYSYAIEAGGNNLEIDHNLFRHGFFPIACFAEPVHGVRIHDNTFDAIEDVGLCIFPGVKDFQFVNNTVVMKKDLSILLLGKEGLAQNPASSEILIIDNLFVLDNAEPAHGGLIKLRHGSTLDQKSVSIKGNAFWNWTPEGEDALVSDPLLERAPDGDRLLQMSPNSLVRAAGKGAKP